MHLITLSTPRWLISGVDITLSITRQEYDFFLFHYKPYNLCTSHYNQPFNTIPFSCMDLIIPFHLLIFFQVIYSENSLQVCMNLLFTCDSCGFLVVVTLMHCKMFILSNFLWARYTILWASCGSTNRRMLGRYSWNSSAVGTTQQLLRKKLPKFPLQLGN